MHVHAAQHRLRGARQLQTARARDSEPHRNKEQSGFWAGISSRSANRCRHPRAIANPFPTFLFVQAITRCMSTRGHGQYSPLPCGPDFCILRPLNLALTESLTDVDVCFHMPSYGEADILHIASSLPQPAYLQDFDKLPAELKLKLKNFAFDVDGGVNPIEALSAHVIKTIGAHMGVATSVYFNLENDGDAISLLAVFSPVSEAGHGWIVLMPATGPQTDKTAVDVLTQTHADVAACQTVRSSLTDAAMSIALASDVDLLRPPRQAILGFEIVCALDALAQQHDAGHAPPPDRPIVALFLMCVPMANQLQWLMATTATTSIIISPPPPPIPTAAWDRR